ncbi:hypothetical protein [Azotobacter beijerinckii]|uniref:hypothetical protein n=1 Tax=Azotobacter beijerinckii TaxID=170623 RepID=UPI00295402C6|nr:hypothetical protein [Azotobacter beijerinckii]MDV7210906.1 hypothetical protein [Azotobacter beijerinckii]
MNPFDRVPRRQEEIARPFYGDRRLPKREARVPYASLKENSPTNQRRHIRNRCRMIERCRRGKKPDKTIARGRKSTNRIKLPKAKSLLRIKHDMASDCLLAMMQPLDKTLAALDIETGMAKSFIIPP